MRFMLDDCTTWAIVGLSGDPTRTAFSIAALLQGRGKRIVPIHPDAPTVLDEQGYPTLADVPFPIDVVDVFRRSDGGRRVRRPGGGDRGQGGVVPARSDRRGGLRPDRGRRRADGDGHLSRDRVASPPAGPVNRPGSDLRVPPGPGLPDGLVIPAGELVERFSRSPGPGGQSVNTSDTRVELRFDVTGSPALSEQQRERATARLSRRLEDGRLVVVASEHRSQHRNRTAARERLVELLSSALAPPPPTRRPTRPTRGSQRRRLDAKRQRGETKALRRPVQDE